MGTIASGSADAARPRRSWVGKLIVRSLLVLASLAVTEVGFRVTLAARGATYDRAGMEETIRDSLRDFDGRTFLERNVRIRHRDVPQPELVGRVPHPFIGWQTRRARADLERRIRSEATASPDTIKIWVVGGSVAGLFARQTRGAKRLIELLSEDERLAGKDIVTRSYALASFKQPQQLMYVGYLFSLGLAPDAIINIDGFNEVALGSLNTEYDSSPIFPAIDQWGSVAIPYTSIPELAEAHADLRGLIDRARWLGEGVLDRGLAQSALIGWCTERKMRSYVRSTGRLRRRYHDAILAQGGGEILSGPREDGGRSAFERITDNWVESSVSLQGMCAARGIRYLHVLQPTLHDAGSKPLTEEEIAGSTMRDSWVMGAREGYPLLRAAAPRLAAAGVPFLDASGLFREVPEALYVDGCHFNETGDHLLAEAIAPVLGGLFP